MLRFYQMPIMYELFRFVYIPQYVVTDDKVAIKFP